MSFNGKNEFQREKKLSNDSDSVKGHVGWHGIHKFHIASIVHAFSGWDKIDWNSSTKEG